MYVCMYVSLCVLRISTNRNIKGDYLVKQKRTHATFPATFSLYCNDTITIFAFEGGYALLLLLVVYTCDPCFS